MFESVRLISIRLDVHDSHHNSTSLKYIVRNLCNVYPRGLKWYIVKKGLFWFVLLVGFSEFSSFSKSFSISSLLVLIFSLPLKSVLICAYVKIFVEKQENINILLLKVCLICRTVITYRPYRLTPSAVISQKKKELFVWLMLGTLGKIFNRGHIEMFFFFLLFFPENRIWHVKKIVSMGYSKKIGFDSSCKLSPIEKICINCQILKTCYMKCQILFPGKKNIAKWDNLHKMSNPVFW